MSLLVVGLHQRSAPLELLERASLSGDRVAKALAGLRAQPHVSEAVVLSTCMRTEVHAVVERFHPAVGEVRDVLAEMSGLAPEEISDHLYSYWDRSAVTHLFSVAAGLDSAVLGEGEVLSQVKAAWQVAREEESAGPLLSGLFRQAVEVGKRARSETAISRGTTSISAAAVAMAQARLGSLEGKVVVVAGAGEMGTGMAQALGGAGARLYIANRTLSRAEALAAEVSGAAVPLADLGRQLEVADVLLAGAQAPSFLVEEGEVRSVMERRRSRPLLVVDAALPRSIDPAVAEIDGVTLLDLGDLRRFAEEGRRGRQREASRVAAIVEEEVDRHFAEAEARRVAPLLTALRAKAEDIRASELARYRSRLGPIDERSSEVLEALTKAIVAKLLHQPTVVLKEAAGTPRGERLGETAADLFGL